MANDDIAGLVPGFSDLRQAVRLCRGSFVNALLFSLGVNVLMITPAIYMLAVYDSVMSSGSESMLLNIFLLTLLLFVITGGLEWVRSRIMLTASIRLDQLIGGRVFDSMFTQSVASSGMESSAQPLHDVVSIRHFLTGSAQFALFDLPWIPIYLVLLYLFHPVLGEVAASAVLILTGLAYWNDHATRNDIEQADREAIAANLFTQRNLRSAEVVEAMGMLPDMRAVWEQKHNKAMQLQSRAGVKSSLIGALAKTFRLVIQAVLLGLGAYLAMHDHVTSGIVVSGFILLGRALAPLDDIIGSWRGFMNAFEAYKRLNQFLDAVPERNVNATKIKPKGTLVLEDVAYQPSGASAPIIKNISLEIEPGVILGLIGATGSGKSTLARTILGLYRPTQGRVLLDDTPIENWDRQALGEHVGYLPQDVELLDGTISENIARFREVSALKMVEATHAIGIHEMILKFPKGYETSIVAGGTMLSAGQQQRIALARAIYDWPQLVILDEPNSHLDQTGDAALAQLLDELRRLRKTVVVATHRTSLLNHVDKIVMLVNGQVALFGPRDQVVRVISQSQQRLIQRQEIAGLMIKPPAA